MNFYKPEELHEDIIEKLFECDLKQDAETKRWDADSLGVKFIENFVVDGEIIIPLNYVHVLNLKNCDLKSLKNFPRKVYTLDISDNELSSLENLPKVVKSLDISNNSLTNKDFTYMKDFRLETLDISKNKFTSLENSPVTTGKLVISNNPITTLKGLFMEEKCSLIGHKLRIKTLEYLRRSFIPKYAVTSLYNISVFENEFVVNSNYKDDEDYFTQLAEFLIDASLETCASEIWWPVESRERIGNLIESVKNANKFNL